MELRCPICKARLFRSEHDTLSCICGFSINTETKKGELSESSLSLDYNKDKHVLLKLISEHKPDYVVSKKPVKTTSFRLSDVTFIFIDKKKCSGLPVDCISLANASSKDIAYNHLICIKGLWVPDFMNTAAAILRSRPNEPIRLLNLNTMPLDSWLYLMCLVTSDASRGFSWEELTPVLRLGVPSVFKIQEGYGADMIVAECVDEALAYNYMQGPLYSNYGHYTQEQLKLFYDDLDKNCKNICDSIDVFNEILLLHVKEVFNTDKLDNPLVKDFLKLYINAKYGKDSDDFYDLLDAGYPGGIDLTWKEFLVKNPPNTSISKYTNYMEFLSGLREVTHRSYMDSYGRDYMLSHCNTKAKDTVGIIKDYYSQFIIE